jgi:hypothetical protein
MIRHLLVSAFVLLVPGLAWATPQSEITQAFNRLPAPERTALGSALGPVVDTGTGHAKIYQHGGIYYKDGAADAYVVQAVFWERYKELGGVLGFPTSAYDNFDQDFEGGVLAGYPGSVFVVRGSLVNVWTLNSRQKGPLGFPTSDSVITTQTTTAGSFPITMIVSESQSFQGADVSWSWVRLLLGQPAWLAEVDPYTSWVRVQATGTINNPVVGQCPVSIDRGLWERKQPGMPAIGPVLFDDTLCGVPQPGQRRLHGWINLDYRRLSDGTLEVPEASFGINVVGAAPGTPYPASAGLLVPPWPTPMDQSREVWPNQLAGDPLGEWIFLQTVKLSQDRLTAGDIVFP